MTVVFYISGHGFGHASREVEVINTLGSRQPQLRILIRTAADAALLKRTIRVPYELLPGSCDTGIVQRTSVEHDDPATVQAALAFYANYAARVDADISRLQNEDVRLIVGDIPPLAFDVADRLGVPSITIGNFTWDWIYETHPGLNEAAPWLTAMLRRSYHRATLALELPFAGGFEVFSNVQQLPLIARHPTHTRDETREHFGIPADRPAVLLSFGGYGIPSLNFAHLDCPDWTFVVTDRVTPTSPDAGPNRLVYLEEQRFVEGSFRYEDLVAAVDVVMSKPGYGIVSECIACNTPLLYTSRGVFREYDLFVREMPRYLRCRFINQSDLFSGHWREAIDAVIALPAASETFATNGAEIAADVIEAHLK